MLLSETVTSPSPPCDRGETARDEPAHPHKAPPRDRRAGRPVLPLGFLQRFADPTFEQRFLKHYVESYFRQAQASLALGSMLIVGDYLVDRIACGAMAANTLRLTTALPVLLGGLAYSSLERARRRWQPVMAGFVVTVGLCLFVILSRIEASGGAGLGSWVGILNFTFLEFYCFVILGVQFRYAIASGTFILGAFAFALWTRAGSTTSDAAYWSYHVLTLFVLAAGIGWWREYLLRKEFLARAALDDSRAAAELRAVKLAHYDEVTGLPNRRLFVGLATPVLARARAGELACAALHVEIDRLGDVHDVHGRAHADAVLDVVAQRLARSVRARDPSGGGSADDTLARLGDTSFAVLLAALDGAERAGQVAERLLQALVQPILVNGQPMVLSASVGIAMFPRDAEDLTALMRCAELAARAVDDAGATQHAFFDASLDARTRDRVVLEAELRQAIESGQLRLYYQPKVDARDGRIVGAEALVRWYHPERGTVAPGRFIPFAEEIGLMGPLTDWVLREACRSQRRWADEGLGALPIAVNLPASSFADAKLRDRLDELMRAHDLAPSSLVLELTETTLMQDTTVAIEVLNGLRAGGYGLSLDDFGTGYSALAYLKRLPVHELKIDRSFVTDAAHDGRDGALATAVITLGRELELRVVAEGVETEAQAEFLLSRGCVLHQGYLYAGPLPEHEFMRLLANGVVPGRADGPETPSRAKGPKSGTSWSNLRLTSTTIRTTT